MGVGPGASPSRVLCSGAWGALGWVVDELVSLAVRTMGRGGDGTQPSLSSLLDAASLKLELREILFFFFFFLELKLSVISTQKLKSQGGGRLRKINLSCLCFFLPRSGCLGSSTAPAFHRCLSFPGSQSCLLPGGDFYRVSSCVERERERGGVGDCVP